MRAGDAEHPLALEHVLGEPFGAGVIRQARIEQRLDDGIAAAQHVADHDAIEVLRQLRLVPSLVQLDAELAQLRAHGRIDVLVRPGDLMPGGLRKRGDPAHERAADAEDVQAHTKGVVRLLSARGRVRAARI